MKSLKYLDSLIESADGVVLRMSNISMKEQLQAVASQISGSGKKESFQKQEQKNRSSEKEKMIDRAKKAKPKWLDYVQYGVELLKLYFPGAFKPINEVKPLKKGIKQDLVKRLSTIAEIVTEDKACMVKSLAYYVNTAAYHKSVVEGVHRIDIDGNPAGVVSQEEAKYSAERYQTKLKLKQKDNR